MSSSVRLRPDRCLSRVRLAGCQGWLPGDHRRACLGPSRAWRQDRDGATCWLSAELGHPDAIIVLDLAPGAVAGDCGGGGCRCGSPGRTGATATGRAPSRSTSRSRGACPGRTSPAGGPGPFTWRGRSRRLRSPSERSTAGRCPSGPLCWSASSTSPIRVAPREAFIRSGSYAHVPNGYSGDASETILGQLERFAPGFRERIVAQLDPGSRRPGCLQQQLRRRGHHHGGQHAGPGPDQAALRARSLQHRHRRRLHLLGRDAAGSGRPRHERVQLRPLRAEAPRLRRGASVVIHGAPQY